MQIKIDNSSNRPVYQQIMDAVKKDIALGKLLPGQKLATVRQLASELVINPNTIAKAYKQLENEGIIATRAGAGAFVAELNTNLNKTVRKKLLCNEIERIMVDAVHMRIDAEEFKDWFIEILEKYKNSFGE